MAVTPLRPACLGTNRHCRTSIVSEERMRTFIALMAGFLLVSALAFAQKKGEEPNRSVQGVVTSAEEAPLSKAVVQLKNTKTLQIRSFITQENGSYYFHGLSPDVDYELKAEYQGGASDTKTLSTFDSRKQAVINLKLNKK
jgi:hypothetical protein